MGGVVKLLTYAGFTEFEIKGILLLGLTALIACIYGIFKGRFLKYRINGVEVIKDRKHDKEYITFKYREI